jgi:hypothetical protein
VHYVTGRLYKVNRLSENEPAVKVDHIAPCDIYWSYVSSEGARRRWVMKSGDTKTVYVQVVYLCIRKYVCILGLCMPQILFFWKCTWSEYQTWKKAVQKPLKIRTKRFFLQESENVEGSGPNGSKISHYFEKRDKPTDLTLLKFFFFMLFYDVSVHVRSTPYFGSTWWMETKYKLDIEYPRWCLRLQISVCSIVSDTQQTTNILILTTQLCSF